MKVFPSCCRQLLWNCYYMFFSWCCRAWHIWLFWIFVWSYCAHITQNVAVRGAILNLFSTGSEHFACCLFTLGILCFCRSALSTWSCKKTLKSARCLLHFIFLLFNGMEEEVGSKQNFKALILHWQTANFVVT